MIHPIVDNSKYLARGAVDERIKSMRRLMEPSPVRTGHVPGWLGLALRRAYYPGYSGVISNSAWYSLTYAQARLGTFSWLDHYGTSVIGGIRCFVGEPYGFSSECAKQLCRIQSDTGLTWWVTANSWHYPGYTVRVVINPPGAK